MLKKIKGYLKKLFKILKMPEMAILPANIAYYLFLAIFPLLTILVLLASSFDISIDLVSNLIRNIMPEQVSEAIIEIISGKGFDTNVGLFNILAFVFASNGTYAVITTSNTLYGIKNSDFIKDRISSFILLIIIIILFVFLMIVPVFGENILSLMQNAKLLENYADEALMLFKIIKWPLTIMIIYFNIKLIYTIAPSKNIKSCETTIGATFTTILWILSTIIFKFYLTYFARYDILYGNLSSMIIMLVWLYFLSYIFVLGMAINVSKKEEQQLVLEQIKIEEEQLEKEKVKRKKKKTKKKNRQKENNSIKTTLPNTLSNDNPNWLQVPSPDTNDKKEK